MLHSKGLPTIESVATGPEPLLPPAMKRPAKAGAVWTLGKLGSPPLVVPRNPGSWPGYRFTSPPLSLPAGDFGLGHGTGAHAPDEYYLIDSKNPKIKGLDGAAASFVEFLYAMA